MDRWKHQIVVVVVKLALPRAASLEIFLNSLATSPSQVTSDRVRVSCNTCLGKHCAT